MSKLVWNQHYILYFSWWETWFGAYKHLLETYGCLPTFKYQKDKQMRENVFKKRGPFLSKLVLKQYYIPCFSWWETWFGAYTHLLETYGCMLWQLSMHPVRNLACLGGWCTSSQSAIQHQHGNKWEKIVSRNLKCNPVMKVTLEPVYKYVMWSSKMSRNSQILI